MTRLRNQAGILVGMLMLVVASAPSATAEYSVDIYAGAAITNDTDLKQTSTRGTTTVQTVDGEAALLRGARVGYWFESLDWLGVGLDIFVTKANAPSRSIASSSNGFSSINSGAGFSLPVIGIGLDVVRLRAPLFRSEDFPHGRLQPYVSGGPALFVTWADTVAGLQPTDQDERHFAVGYKAGGGIAFLLSKSAALFTEYRFTHSKSEMTFQDATIPPTSNETFETTLNTHQIIVGFSVRFSAFRTQSQ